MKENEKDQKGKMNKPGQKSQEQNKGTGSQNFNSPAPTINSDEWSEDELDFSNETDIKNKNGDRENASKGRNSSDDY